MRGEEVHAKHARTGRTTTTKTVDETPNKRRNTLSTKRSTIIDEQHCAIIKHESQACSNSSNVFINIYIPMYRVVPFKSFLFRHDHHTIIVSSYHPSFYLSPLPPRRRRRRPPTPAPTPPVALPAFTSFRPCRARPKETFTSQWHVLSFPDGASTSRRG